MSEAKLTRTGTGVAGQIVRFEQNIQTIISRMRILYGSTPLEDVVKYNHVVRGLGEWSATNSSAVVDQTSFDGVGGYAMDSDGQGNHVGFSNIRQKYIHGSTGPANGTALFQNSTPGSFSAGTAYGNVGTFDTPAGLNTNVQGFTRRYQVTLLSGLLTQPRLIPLKFMAASFIIELTFEQAQSCMYCPPGPSMGVPTLGVLPTYGVGNVNFIPEILNFDASFGSCFIYLDAVQLMAIKKDGIPLGYSSFHQFIFSSQSSATVAFAIQEKSRSVKAVFALQRRAIAGFEFDNGATFFDTSVDGASTLQDYQFRIGTRYYPPSPVQCSANGSSRSNGAVEAFQELQKALNQVGDYRLSTNTSVKSWGLQNSDGVLQEYDFSTSLVNVDQTGTNIPAIVQNETSGAAATFNAFCGTLPSSNFAMAVSLETSNGNEISGLNAEEQSDITLIAHWRKPQVTGLSVAPSDIEVFTYYDSMVVLRPNNAIELIQ